MWKKKKRKQDNKKLKKCKKQSGPRSGALALLQVLDFKVGGGSYLQNNVCHFSLSLAPQIEPLTLQDLLSFFFSQTNVLAPTHL
jgi:hypothetical protein